VVDPGSTGMRRREISVGILSGLHWTICAQAKSRLE
jgi:hypothetical protein